MGTEGLGYLAACQTNGVSSPWEHPEGRDWLPVSPSTSQFHK